MSSEMSAIMTGAPEDPLPHGLLVPRRHVSHLSRLTPHIPLTGDSMPSSQHAYLIEQSASSNECKRAAPPLGPEPRKNLLSHPTKCPGATTSSLTYHSPITTALFTDER